MGNEQSNNQEKLDFLKPTLNDQYQKPIQQVPQQVQPAPQAQQQTIASNEWRIGMQHPHLLQTLGGQQEGDQYRYYFEFCQITLASLLQERYGTKKYFPEEDLQAMLLGISSALSYLQEKGISHGGKFISNIDICANEVYFDGNSSSFKILDSNLINGRAAAINQIRQGVFKPLAPEIFGEKHLTEMALHKNDIWALGMLMLESATLKQNEPIYQMGIQGYLINERINEVAQIYNVILAENIALMLNFNPEDRPDPVNLFNYLLEQQRIAAEVSVPQPLYPQHYTQQYQQQIEEPRLQIVQPPQKQYPPQPQTQYPPQAQYPPQTQYPQYPPQTQYPPIPQQQYQQPPQVERQVVQPQFQPQTQQNYQQSTIGPQSQIPTNNMAQYQQSNIGPQYQQNAQQYPQNTQYQQSNINITPQHSQINYAQLQQHQQLNYTQQLNNTQQAANYATETQFNQSRAPVKVIKKLVYPDGRVEYQEQQTQNQQPQPAVQRNASHSRINYQQQRSHSPFERTDKVLGNIENQYHNDQNINKLKQEIEHSKNLIQQYQPKSNLQNTQNVESIEERIRKVIAQSQALRENFA